jgi:hypothetical protein
MPARRTKINFEYVRVQPFADAGRMDIGREKRSGQLPENRYSAALL